MSALCSLADAHIRLYAALRLASQALSFPAPAAKLFASRCVVKVFNDLKVLKVPDTIAPLSQALLLRLFRAEVLLSLFVKRP